MLEVPYFSFTFSLVTRMVLGLSKWLKETRFHKKKKKKYKDMNFAFMKVIFQSSKKKKNSDRIFSLAWNIVYVLLKSHCFQFFEGGKYFLF